MAKQKSNLRKFIECVLVFAAFVLLLDFVSFFAWVASGQTPFDSFYFGAVTNYLLQLILL